MSKFERDKGLRIEREIINLHKEIGVPAERVPLSGASHYRSAGHDVDIYPLGKDEAPLVCEVKGRASGAGFTMLERWLADYDVLFLRRDRQDPLVVVPWRTWSVLLKELEKRQQKIQDRSVGVLLTNTRLYPNGERDDATCARREVKRGEGDEHSDEL